MMMIIVQDRNKKRGSAGGCMLMDEYRQNKDGVRVKKKILNGLPPLFLCNGCLQDDSSTISLGG